MKKAFLIAALAVMVAVSAAAQEKRAYGNFDFEIGVTTPVAAPRLTGETNAPIPFFYIEGR